MKKQLYSMKDNWSTFEPHLKDAAVMQALAESLGFNDVQAFEVDGRGPWEYTPTDYWVTEIDDRVENDADYHKEYDLLFGDKSDEEMDELDDAFFELHERYFAKHKPQPYTFDWYQFKHGCHYISHFTKQLIMAALPTARYVRINRTPGHSVVQFRLNGTMYYADLINKWTDVAELEDFMKHSKPMGHNR